MNEIYNKLDELYLEPAVDRRKLSHYDRIRKLTEIEMTLDRIKLLSNINKRKGGDEMAVPFLVDQEGNC